MLAALAQATTWLRLGTLVSALPYRHPALLANMAATVDIISGGRLKLGIGAGGHEQETVAYGIELGSLRERFDRFDEGCEVLVALLSQETTDFQGKYYNLTAARCEPKRPQKPHPPIMIGGTGEKRTLRAVARYAQLWDATFARSPEGLVRKREALHEHCEKLGRELTRSQRPTTSGSSPLSIHDGLPSRSRRSPIRVSTWRSCTSVRRWTPAS